ncbi:hypothetical protein ACFE04_000068 [Oxalis oulophora]
MAHFNTSQGLTLNSDFQIPWKFFYQSSVYLSYVALLCTLQVLKDQCSSEQLESPHIGTVLGFSHVEHRVSLVESDQRLVVDSRGYATPAPSSHKLQGKLINLESVALSFHQYSLTCLQLHGNPHFLQKRIENIRQNNDLASLKVMIPDSLYVFFTATLLPPLLVYILISLGGTVFSLRGHFLELPLPLWSNIWTGPEKAKILKCALMSLLFVLPAILGKKLWEAQISKYCQTDLPAGLSLVVLSLTGEHIFVATLLGQRYSQVFKQISNPTVGDPGGKREILLRGYPSELFYKGCELWETLYGILLAFPLVMYFFIPVYFSLGITSVYQYLDMRFKSKLVRRIASATYVVRTLLLLGVATFTPCIAIKTVIGIPYYVSITVMIVVSIVFMFSDRVNSGVRVIFLWTFVVQLAPGDICPASLGRMCPIGCERVKSGNNGGFSSALMGDVVQGVLMLLVCCFVIVKGTIEAGGPWNDLHWIPLGSQLDPAWISIGSQFYPTWISIGSQLDPARISIGSQLDTTRISIGSHMDLNWISIGFHLDPTGIQLGSQLDPTWISIGFHLDPTWISIGSHLNPTWISIGYHVDPT